MSFILLIIYLLVAAIIGFAGLLVVGSLRSKGSLARALNMSLFLITMPHANPSPDQPQKPDKELIGVMEQLYNSLSNIHAKGWNKFLYGEPYVSFEMAVHHIGEEIHFYAALPRSYEQIFEKQVHGLYPTAEVKRVPDYNIFNPHGAAAGTYLKLQDNPVLPVKTYSHQESDPLGEIVTALSKLEREGEGAAIQILFRPAHRDDIRKLAQRVAQFMQKGNDFTKALALAKKGPEKPKKKDDNNLAEPPKVATAFEEETIKLLQNKASRVLYDANVRMLVSARDQARADQLLKDAVGAFVQFSAPDLNSFQAIGLRDRALKKIIFNYSFRVFDAGQTVQLSSE